MKEIVSLIDDGKFAEAKSKLKIIVGERIEKRVEQKLEDLGLVKEAKKIKKEEDEKEIDDEKNKKELDEQEDEDKKDKETDDDDKKEVDEKEKGKK